MGVSGEVASFSNQLHKLADDYKLIFNCLNQLKDEIANNSLIRKSEEYLKNQNSRMKRIKEVYISFSSQINYICDSFKNEVKNIEEEERDEIAELNNDFEKVQQELSIKCKDINNTTLSQPKEPSYYYKNNKKSKMDIKLVMKYPGSYVYKNDHRTADGDVFIDCDGKYDELIVKYMKNDKSLEDEV